MILYDFLDNMEDTHTPSQNKGTLALFFFLVIQQVERK